MCLTLRKHIPLVLNAKLDRKYERQNAQGLNAYIKVNNTFAKHINPMLDELNNKPEYKDKNLYDNKKLHDKYMKEYEGLVGKAAKATTDELGTNASGTRQMQVSRVGFGEEATWQAEMVDLKHASDSSPFAIKITPTFNKTGHIVGQKIERLNPSVAHADALAHSSVKVDSIVKNFLSQHGNKKLVNKNHK